MESKCLLSVSLHGWRSTNGINPFTLSRARAGIAKTECHKLDNEQGSGSQGAEELQHTQAGYYRMWEQA